MLRTWLAVCIVLGSTASAQESQPAATGAAQAAAAGDRWPWRLPLDRGGVLVVYPPQIESWEGNRLKARAAIALRNSSDPAADFGVARLSATTHVAKDRGTVALENIQLDEIKFPADPNLSDADLLQTRLRAGLPKTVEGVNLARLQASLDLRSARERARTVPLNNDPPQIYFSQTPALLVLMDGPPVLRPVLDSTLQRVINTRVLLLFDSATNAYYLHIMNRWLPTPAGPQPPPASAAQEPALVRALQQARDAALAAGPVDLLDMAAATTQPGGDAELPRVIVCPGPAELIVTQGPPSFALIPGTGLLAARNTTGDLFRLGPDGRYFVLISGRWFSAAALDGPWAFVPHASLPADFAKIPLDHPKADVLVCVPGTPQSQEALIAASIPQTAKIRRTAAQLTVAYDGPPKFEPIDGTELSGAVNTPTPVIRVRPDSFFAVENGVWFEASSAEGLWQVATRVPDAIYSIPPSSPLHYATHVYVYGATPETVSVGYTLGYYGVCVAPDPVLVYGTGWQYPRYVGGLWIPQPTTYGYGAGFAWRPDGGFGVGFGLGAATGVSMGTPAWGPFAWNTSAAARVAGARGWGGYASGAPLRNINFNRASVYGRWGAAVVDAGEGAALAVAPSSDTGAPPPGPLGENNVFAGSDGETYRLAQNAWERFDARARVWQRAEEATRVFQSQPALPPAPSYVAPPPWVGGGGGVPQALNVAMYARNNAMYRAENLPTLRGGWGADILPNANPANFDNDFVIGAFRGGGFRGGGIRR